jgi:RNA polymerase sigma-32 factor
MSLCHLIALLERIVSCVFHKETYLMALLDGVHRQLVRKAMTAPYLEREEEYSLIEAWKQRADPSALDKLIHAHMRLVLAIAAKFRQYGLPITDLVQEGHIGLMEAANRFELDRDVRFSTYATWWVRAAMQDYVLRNWSVVRGGTSSSQKSLFFNLRRLRAKLMLSGEQISSQDVHADIATKLGVSVAEVAAMDARLAAPDYSLNATYGDGEGDQQTERQDFLVDSGPTPDVLVMERLDEERRDQILKSALKVLNERELKILQERRLRDDGDTLEALGRRLGVSKERVRQIEHRAMEKLKKALQLKGFSPSMLRA